ncbi:MAG: ABC transporter ATP-binding protein [Methanogenium sp.]|nr:ABC transporter ATP-binding protein [Methanogenium sp.]
MKRPVIELDNLSVTFHGDCDLRAVNQVSLSVTRGEVLALVGETGCGKSVIAHAIMGLLPKEASVDGSIRFNDMELLSLSERELADIRGEKIAIIFQNPSLSLNPVYTVEHQISESLYIHRKTRKELAEKCTKNYVLKFGFNPPETYLPLYPSQCSGGMNQRILIAASTILSPEIVIADEPTKGLDRERVNETGEILRNLVSEKGRSLILITHDLEFARRISDRIAIMYSGEIVETASAEEFFAEPKHPYSKGLLNSLPENGFVPIKGSSPSLTRPPDGCRFHPRCMYMNEQCAEEHPDLKPTGNRKVRCFLCH